MYRSNDVSMKQLAAITDGRSGPGPFLRPVLTADETLGFRCDLKTDPF